MNPLPPHLGQINRPVVAEATIKDIIQRAGGSVETQEAQDALREAINKLVRVGSFPYRIGEEATKIIHRCLVVCLDDHSAAFGDHVSRPPTTQTGTLCLQGRDEALESGLQILERLGREGDENLLGEVQEWLGRRPERYIVLPCLDKRIVEAFCLRNWPEFLRAFNSYDRGNFTQTAYVVEGPVEEEQPGEEDQPGEEEQSGEEEETGEEEPVEEEPVEEHPVVEEPVVEEAQEEPTVNQ